MSSNQESRKPDSPEDIQREDLLTHHLVKSFFTAEERCMKSFLLDIEKMLIMSILKKTFGNQRATAQILGVKPTTLSEKIKRYGISFDEETILRG